MTQHYTNRELVNLLRRLEFVAPLQSYGDERLCLVCRNTVSQGHARGCKMAQALRGWGDDEPKPPYIQRPTS